MPVADTEFYDTLGVVPDATQAQVKKAYYQRARECHPDKHPGDAGKEEEFKRLGEAYQTLFDAERRAAYDLHGKAGLQGAGSFADARDLYAATFGGPEFEPYVGVLGAQPPEEVVQAAESADAAVKAKAAELRQALQEGAGEERHAALRKELWALQRTAKEATTALAAAAKALQQQRVAACAAALLERIAPYVELTLVNTAVQEELTAARRAASTAEYRETVQGEFEKLRQAPMGEPMLRAIGYAYSREASKQLGQRSESGALSFSRLGGFFEEVVEGTHRLGEGIATVGSAVSVAQAHVRLARDAHPDTPESVRLSEQQKAELQQYMQQQTLQLLWRLTKRDVEDTARGAVQALLGEPGLDRRTRQARADSLLLYGEIFRRAKGFDSAVLGKKAPLGEQVTEAVNSGLSGLNEAAAQADEHLLPHLQVAVARAGESVSNFFVDLGLTGPHATPSYATTGEPSALRAESDADEPPPPPPEGFVGVYVPPATEAPPRYSTGGSSGAVEAAAAVEAELSPPSAANTRPTTPDKV